ncbi:MAG: S8 family serine peptidase [Clostridia bacterium]|nr:S8 family serine peptidase [Clostridia bacterium]
MKTKFTFFLLGLLLLLPLSAHASQSRGYIFALPSGPSLFGAESRELPADATAIAKNYYWTDDADFIARNQGKITAFPNYKMTLFEESSFPSPNDSAFANQWNLDLIHAAAAREKGLSGKGVRIGVIDSGLNTAHLDLNPQNIPYGYNCAMVWTPNGDGTETPNWPEDADDVTDLGGHGTMVSGIIAAQTNNNLGIAGVASGASILPIKVADADGNIYLNDVFIALQVAIIEECDVINISLGDSLTDIVAGRPVVNTAALSTMQYFIDEALNAGIVVVAAAGNNGTDGSSTTVTNYPAGCSGVISVSSVTQNADGSIAPANTSCKNDSVFISAPGGGKATLNGVVTTPSQTPAIYSLAKNSNTGLNYGTGTSFAAPQVAAAVALIREAWPTCTPAEIQAILSATAKDLGTEGRDIIYGHGLLDIEAIVDYLDAQNRLPDYAISFGYTRSEQKPEKITSSCLYIHNNTTESTAPALYLAEVDGEVKSAIRVNLSDFNAATVDALSGKRTTGITKHVLSETGKFDYDWLFLWDGFLRPLIKKQSLSLQ